MLKRIGKRMQIIFKSKRNKMTTLKNKNLRKSKKKLILIFSVLIIASLNLFGEDKRKEQNLNTIIIQIKYIIAP